MGGLARARFVSLWRTIRGTGSPALILIGGFETESAALVAVRAEIETNNDAEMLLLQRDRAGMASEVVASGRDLASQAQRTGRSVVAG